jgi:hypothetical protein
MASGSGPSSFMSASVDLTVAGDSRAGEPRVLFRRWRRTPEPEPIRADDAWRAEFSALVREVAVRNHGRAGVPSLGSVRELAQVDEEEMAVDHLCHVVASFGLSLTRAHYTALAGLAGRVGMADILEDIDLEPFIEP